MILETRLTFHCTPGVATSPKSPLTSFLNQREGRYSTKKISIVFKCIKKDRTRLISLTQVWCGYLLYASQNWEKPKLKNCGIVLACGFQ